MALPHRAQQLAQPQHLGGLGRRVDRAAVREDALEADEAAGPQQAQRFSEVVQALQPVAVAEDQVVAAVGEPRQDVEGAAGDEARPVAGEARRAEGLPGELLPLRLGSTVVSTPSGRMPCSRWMPETPVPVPISATALASAVAASRRSAAPVPGDTERSPASRARSRAQRSGVVLGDEGVGERPARLPVGGNDPLLSP